MTTTRLFQSEKSKAELESKSAIPTYTLEESDVETAFVFYGRFYPYDAYRCKVKRVGDEKSQFQTVICRGMYDERLFQLEVETAQRIGEHPALLKMIGTMSKPVNWLPCASFAASVVYENAGTQGSLHEMLFNLDPNLELRYPLVTRIDWISDAISAFKHLHQLNIVHGELTPKDILFDIREGEMHLKIANVHPQRMDEEFLKSLEGETCEEFDQYRWRWFAPESPVMDYKKIDIWLLGRIIAEMVLFRIPYATYFNHFQIDCVNKELLPFNKQELQAEIGPHFADLISQCCAIDPEKRPTIDEVANTLWPKVQFELMMLAAREQLISFKDADIFHLPDTSVMHLQEKLKLKSPEDTVQLYGDLSSMCSKDSYNYQRLVATVQKLGFVAESEYKSESDRISNLYAFWFLVARDGLIPDEARKKLSDMNKVRELATGIDERTLARISEINKAHLIKPEFCKLPLQAKMGIARVLARCPILHDKAYLGEPMSVLMALVCDPKYNFNYVDALGHMDLGGSPYLKDIERIARELRKKTGSKEEKSEEVVSVGYKR